MRKERKKRGHILDVFEFFSIERPGNHSRRFRTIGLTEYVHFAICTKVLAYGRKG